MMVRTEQDLHSLLDSLVTSDRDWWDRFYADRSRQIPFFKNAPDENLVEYFERGLLNPGRVLELGCGPGRNAVYFERQGCHGDAVDISEAAIKWAGERLGDQSRIHLHHVSMFDLASGQEPYDIIYDAGCFHHLFPHRRMDYVSVVKDALKPDGRFAMVCFKKEYGSGLTDEDVYRNWDNRGGQGYDKGELTDLLETDFAFLEFREMRDVSDDPNLFGLPLFWTILMQRK